MTTAEAQQLLDPEKALEMMRNYDNDYERRYNTACLYAIRQMEKADKTEALTKNIETLMLIISQYEKDIDTVKLSIETAYKEAEKLVEKEKNLLYKAMYVGEAEALSYVKDICDYIFPDGNSGKN